MMNVIAKSLVLVQAVLSIAAMTWAIMLVLQSRDLGWKEPAKEVFEYNSDGTPSSKPGAVVRYPSEFDKSVIAVKEAGYARDRAYRHVQPALDAIDQTENLLPENHLWYLSQLKRLKEGDPGKKDFK